MATEAPITAAAELAAAIKSRRVFVYDLLVQIEALVNNIPEDGDWADAADLGAAGEMLNDVAELLGRAPGRGW